MTNPLFITMRVGSGHIKVIDANCPVLPDGSDNVVLGCYGKDDQQAFDRLKRFLGHRIKELGNDAK